MTTLETQETQENTTVAQPAVITPDVVMIQGEEVFDFSGPVRNIRFKIDDDIFDAIRELPGLTGMEFAAFAATVETSNDAQEQIDTIERMFRLVLKKDSADRFLER